MAYTVKPLSSCVFVQGDEGWSASGVTANTYNAEGCQYATHGNGSATATWTFTGLSNGSTYQIGLAWGASTNRSVATPWTISDGSGVLTSGTINQQNVATADFTSGSNNAPFQKLGANVSITIGTSLIVQITNLVESPNVACADAALLNPVSGVSFYPWFLGDQCNEIIG